MDNRPTTASFGYWVKRRRLALDLTQAALAHHVGCATVTIKKIEYDERRPSPQMAERLAEILAVPAEERETFLAAALHEQPVDKLPLSQTPLFAAPPWLEERHEPASAETRFVGREQEQATLDAALKQALASSGTVRFVTGEAGRGKTALLTEYARRATDAYPDLLVAWGRCTAAGAGDPYLPFRDLLVDLVGDVESDWRAGRLSAAQARRLWEFAPQVVETVWQAGPQLVNTLLPVTSLKHGLAAATARSAGEERDEGQQEQIFAALTILLTSVAQQRPLLLLLDDLQWADSASLALLFHLGHRLPGSRILLLGSYRPTEAGVDGGPALPAVVRELERRLGEIVVNLDQFDLPLERRFLDAILDREPNRLDEEFRLRFFWRTRGHPLFTVELLRDLRAQGALVQDENGKWIVGESINWETMPARVEAVIARRVGRLPEALRDLLAVASVEGDSFTAQVVAALQGSDERAVFRQLAQLQDKYGLVQEQEELAVGGLWLARYQFHHILFQQYVYQQLGQAERRHLHGAVGQALEGFWAVDEQSAELPADGIVLSQFAHHFAEAGQDEKAAAYLIRLGDRARTLYANREAVTHYERALEHLRKATRGKADREATGRLLMKLGLTHQSAFNYVRAQLAFDEAFSLMPERDPAWAKARSSQALRPLRMVWRDPLSLDPTMGGYNFLAPLASQLFSGLVAFGPENEILPDVAYRWEIEEDGRRYRFHLRDDVFWSDGQRVTAHDFAFTYRRALDPTTAAPVASQLLYPVRGAREHHQGEHHDAGRLGIRALDDNTFMLELEEATTYFIQNLAYYVMLPVPQHVVLAHGQEWVTPGRIVTNGPFRLAAWEQGQHMLLERNPRFHGSFSGNVKEIQLTLGEAAFDQVGLYAAGEIDVASNWFGTAEEIAHLHQLFPAEYARRRSFWTWYYFVVATRPPFDDKRVLQALAMAVDRHALAEGPLQGYVTAATGGFVPPGMPGHLPDCALPYDPGEARRLLAASGYRHKGPVTLMTYPRRERSVRFLQESWQRELGLDIRLEVVDGGSLSEFTARPEPLLMFGSWWADYPDPDNFLRVDVDPDLPQLRQAGYYGLLAQAGRITDQAERLRLYQHAERILAEEAVLVPLYYQPFHLMLKPWVKRYPTAAVKNFGFWKDVVMEPEVGG